MKIETHDRLEAVGEAAWGALVARARLPSPFLSWSWQTEWVRAFAPGRRLEIIQVTDAAGQLAGVLPLCELGPGRLQLLGGADVSDYLDLIAVAGREEAVWAALLEARGTSRDVWELHSIPAASPTVTALPALAAAAGVAADATVEEQCPVLALPASWDAYLGALSGKHRHELTRKLRRMQREAPDARAAAAGEPAAVAARLPDFLRLHRASRAGKAKFMDARMEAFFRGITAALAGRRELRLWFLDTGAGPLASFITLEWGDRVGLYNSGFEPSQAALSPGLVLLAHVIQDAIARGKARFDFLRGEERYKYEFGPSPEPVYAVRVGGMPGSGAAA